MEGYGTIANMIPETARTHNKGERMQDIHEWGASQAYGGL